MKFIIIFLCSYYSAFGYVPNKSESGENIKWTIGNTNLIIETNPAPVKSNISLDLSSSGISNLGMTEDEYTTYRIKQIINQSATQWNNISPYKIKLDYTSSPTSVGSGSSSTFRFTSNYSYFGSGVIAVTSLIYNKRSGSINSADILINQSSTSAIDLTLSPDESSQNQAYLGDVITHEFGHFLGLAHSETIGSTMIYSIFKNQYDVHEDDIAAIQTIYSDNDEPGVLAGRVVAGDFVGIFGLQVEVFSAITNQIIQSQMTDKYGKFYIENLPINHSYYLKISSILNSSTLPDYFKNINNQLCAQKDFQASFVTKCGPRSKGRPQVYYLSESTDYLDLGDLTIRCDENLDTNYYALKFESAGTFYQMNKTSSINTVFQGHFSASEVLQLNSESDYFLLDYSDREDLDSSNTVRITINAAEHKSGYDLYAYAKRNDSSYTKYELNSSGVSNKKEVVLTIDLALSNDSSQNIFQLIITPQAFDSDDIYEIFSTPNLMLGKEGSYSISAIVGSLDSNMFSSLEDFSDYPYEDNASCVEGTVEYSAQPYVSLTDGYSGESGDDSDLTGISCGTIQDINNHGPPGGGLMSFVIGFSLLLSFSFISNNIHKFLSKY